MEQTLEQLLEEGKVESALLLRGDFTPHELDLVRRAYGLGVEAGKAASSFRGALEEIAGEGCAMASILEEIGRPEKSCREAYEREEARV